MVFLIFPASCLKCFHIQPIAYIILWKTVAQIWTSLLVVGNKKAIWLALPAQLRASWDWSYRQKCLDLFQLQFPFSFSHFNSSAFAFGNNSHFYWDMRDGVMHHHHDHDHRRVRLGYAILQGRRTNVRSIHRSIGWAGLMFYLSACIISDWH